MRRFEHSFAYYTLRSWLEPERGAGARVSVRDEFELVALLRELAGNPPNWTLGPLLLELGMAHEPDAEVLLWKIARLVVRGELVLEREPRIVLASDTVVRRAPFAIERVVNEIDEGFSLYPGVRLGPSTQVVVHAKVAEPTWIVVGAVLGPAQSIEVGARLGPPSTLAVAASVGSNSAA